MKKIILTLVLLLLLVINTTAQRHWGSGEGLTLITPSHNEEVNETHITFKWKYEGYDAFDKDIKYEMYLGENKGKYPLVTQSINPHANKFSKGGFLRESKYWWRIVCSKNDRVMTWVDGYFTVSQKLNGDKDVVSICLYCKGSGKILIPVTYKTCERCKGTGRYPPNKEYGRIYKCGEDTRAKFTGAGCGGSGKSKIDAHYESCRRCDGMGQIK